MDELEIIGTCNPPHSSKHSMSTVPEEEEPDPDEQAMQERYNVQANYVAL